MLLLDSNGDDRVDISDAVHILLFIFSDGSPPDLGTRCVRLYDCPAACAQ